MLKITFILICCLHLSIPRKFDNPILNQPTDSPGVVKFNESYYAVGTFDPFVEESMPIYVSTDLKNWEAQGLVFDQTNLPPWCKPDIEINAPEIYVMEDGTFNLYFTATHASTGNLAIGVATAANILGPYNSTESPLLINNFSNTGATLLKDDDNLYMIYSAINGSLVFFMVGQELSRDGLSLKSTESTLLLVPEDSFFYFGLFGATAFSRQEYYYIIYSQMDSCTFYSTDGLLVARSKSPLGPYEVLDEQITGTYEDYRAPAQPSLVKDLDDESDLLIFHTFNNNNCDGPYLTAASLGFDEISGWPYFPDYP